ncbi:MAG: hypothetical protein J7J87_03795 [Candidatus Diapherotrites archaeon]|nr:hypothetical protein [Candidatus Diapherotrites archaeon]
MPAPYYLSNLKYREAKGIMLVEFEGESDKIKLSYEFFPSFSFKANSKSGALLSELLSENFDVDFIQKDSLFRISAKNFKELKSAYNFLCNTTLLRPILIEPERQFLILKNWSYYDAFSIGEFPKKLDILAYIPEHLESPNSVVLANLLQIKCKEQLTKDSIARIFLENILFASGKSLSCPNSSYTKKHFYYTDFYKLFTFAVAAIKNNLGFETINCDCCKSTAIASENVLANSLVLVKFSQNGFYFNSSARCFAEHYHHAHVNKTARDSRRKEFSLATYPIGPFFANDIEAIPLIDALRLQQDGSASIIGPKRLFWVCRNKRSALAVALLEILKKLFYANNALKDAEKQALMSNGLLAYVEEDSLTTYLKLYIKLCKDLIALSMSYMLDYSTPFFHYPLASAIECSAAKDAELLVPKTKEMLSISKEQLMLSKFFRLTANFNAKI